MFNQEKGGQLKATKAEVDEYLRNTYSDLEQCREVGLPPGMPPLGEIAHKMDVRPPGWKEVEEGVRHAQASSAPSPNGVPYWVYKSAPDMLKFLWRQLRNGRNSLFLEHGVGQDSVVAQRLASYLERNSLKLLCRRQEYQVSQGV